MCSQYHPFQLTHVKLLYQQGMSAGECEFFESKLLMLLKFHISFMGHLQELSKHTANSHVLVGKPHGLLTLLAAFSGVFSAPIYFQHRVKQNPLAKKLVGLLSLFFLFVRHDSGSLIGLNAAHWEGHRSWLRGKT